MRWFSPWFQVLRLASICSRYTWGEGEDEVVLSLVPGTKAGQHLLQLLLTQPARVQSVHSWQKQAGRLRVRGVKFTETKIFTLATL
jgi:hypothetical protein